MRTKKTRRETLTIIGAAGLATLTACGSDENAGTGPGTTGGGGGSGTTGDTTGGTTATTGSSATTGSTATTGGSGTTGSSSTTTGGTTTTSGSTTTTAGSGGAGGGSTTGNGSGGTGTGGGGSGTGGAGPGDAGTVQCKAKQESTVGPFPNINPLERKDVRGNTTGNTTAKQGTPLTLRIGVYDLSNGCAPIPDAVVDIWHCDAVGVYSGYANFSTAGQDFCRGFQRTDARGIVEFSTIFPGSYSGRAIHIHFSIQNSERNLNPNDNGPNLPGIFVNQFYFTRAVADEIFAATAIYQQGAPITPNESDGIYGQGGRDLIVSMTKSGAGYVGEIQIGVRRSDIGK